MKTLIVNVSKDSCDVYIGRASGNYKASKWANPFKIGPDGSREEVIKKYANWILSQPQLINSLSELEGKVLGCWCKPESCHGDVLVDLIRCYRYFKFEE